MSQWDKLLRKILSLSNDVRFKELQKILESYGYKMTAPKSSSSHYTFRKHGCIPIIYVQMVKQVIESEENNNENA